MKNIIIIAILLFGGYWAYSNYFSTNASLAGNIVETIMQENPNLDKGKLTTCVKDLLGDLSSSELAIAQKMADSGSDNMEISNLSESELEAAAKVTMGIMFGCVAMGQ